MTDSSRELVGPDSSAAAATGRLAWSVVEFVYWVLN